MGHLGKKMNSFPSGCHPQIHLFGPEHWKEGNGYPMYIWRENELTDLASETVGLCFLLLHWGNQPRLKPPEEASQSSQATNLSELSEHQESNFLAKDSQ